MNIKISKEKIWWDDLTDNKPSIEYFDKFKNGMTETTDTMNINQTSFDRIEIVVPACDITYIWVNDGKYNYYYHYNKVINILPECYRIEFSLDKFTTYTLPYWKYLRNNNINLKVNRHKKFEYACILWDDDMLNNVPIQHKSIKQERNNQMTIQVDTNAKRCFVNLNNAFQWGNDAYYRYAFTDAAGKYVNPFHPSLYVVYSDIEGLTKRDEETIALFPVLAANSQYLHIAKPLKPSWWVNVNKKNDDITNKPVVELFNTYDYLTRVMFKTHQKANQFKGLFVGPSIVNFDADKTNIYEYTNANQDKEYAMYVEMKAEGLEAFISLGEAPNQLTLQVPDQLNKKDKLSIYVAKAIDYHLYNNPIDIRHLVEPNDYTNPRPGTFNIQFPSIPVLNFTTSFFISTSGEFFPMGTMLYEYTGDLPVWIDAYDKYIQATKNTRDTGINIAKQDTIKNSTFGVAGNILGAIGGGPLGIVKGIFGGAQSLTNNIMGYQHKKQMMNAELADKRTSLTTSINNASIGDAATYIHTSKIDRNIYGKDGTFNFGDYIEYKELTETTIAALNNVMYLYGLYNPRIATIQQLSNPGSKFDYFQLDTEYLSNIFATTLRGADEVPIQREYYDTIYNQLTEGLRFWNQKPEV